MKMGWCAWQQAHIPRAVLARHLFNDLFFPPLSLNNAGHEFPQISTLVDKLGNLGKSCKMCVSNLIQL